MKKKIILTSKEFLYLHECIVEKFKMESKGGVPNGVRQFYGFALDDSALIDQPSLKRSIEQYLTVKGFFKEEKIDPAILETKNSLYQNYINLTKNPEENQNQAVLNATLLQVFFAYIDVVDLYEFRQRLTLAFPPVEYKMMYYSLLNREVAVCELKVDYESNPYRAEMRGFHRDSRALVFRGNGQKKGTHLYINLECQERSGEEFHLICNAVSFTNPQDYEVMPASFMGLASNSVPACGEAILVKLVNSEFNTEDGLRKLRGVLMLKRNRFNIKNSEIRSLQVLTALGHSVNEWEWIIGRYKVYGFDRFGKWYLSKLEIDRNTFVGKYYTTVFGENSNLSELHVEITITNIIGKIICITTRSQNHRIGDVVSHVMVDLGTMNKVELPTLASFVTVSRHTGKSVAGKIMLIKTNNNFEPQVIQDEEKVSLISESEAAQHLDEMCKEVVQRPAHY